MEEQPLEQAARESSAQQSDEALLDAIDLDRLAKQVYEMLKAEALVERERRNIRR